MPGRLMHTSDVVAAFAAFGGLAGAVAAAILGVRAARQARLVDEVLPTAMGALDAGLHEVRGTFAGERSTTSPVTGRPCLWYRLLVEEALRMTGLNSVPLCSSMRLMASALVKSVVR